MSDTPEQPQPPAQPEWPPPGATPPPGWGQPLRPRGMSTRAKVALGVLGLLLAIGAVNAIATGGKGITPAAPAPTPAVSTTAAQPAPETPTAAPTAAAPPSPTVDPKVSKAAAEGIYAAAVGRQASSLQGVAPSALAEEGYSICKQLRSGQSVKDVVARVRLGFGPAETGAMIGAAPVLCPDQAQKVADGIASLS